MLRWNSWALVLRAPASHGLVALIAVATLVSAAEAASPTDTERSVVLEAGGRPAGLRERLRAELAHGGWIVVELGGTAAPSSGMPERIAQQLHAPAAVRIAPDGAVEFWIIDSTTHETLAHEELAAAADGGVDVASLRIVEILRARLLEHGVAVPEAPTSPAPQAPEPQRQGATAPDGSAAEPPRTAASSAPPTARDRPGAAPPLLARPRPPHELDVAVGTSAALNPGELGPSAALEARATYLASSAWGAGLDVLLPVTPATMDTAAGQVSLVWGMALVTGERRAPLGPLVATVGAGLGAAVVRVSGDAEPGARDAADTVAVAVALARAGVRLPIAGSVSLGVDLSGGAVTPRPVVLASNDRVATWGRPLLGAWIGLEWRAWQGP